MLAGGAITEREDLAHGNYMAPTLLDNVRPEMAIAQEEVFASGSCGIARAGFRCRNSSGERCGIWLSASVFTRSLDNAMRFAREMEAGLVRINGETAGVEPQAPFGGMKNSSSFSREQGQAAREFYTQVKTISIDRAECDCRRRI